MPAQSAIGNPWILTPHTPTSEERLSVIIRHLDLAMATEICFRQAQQEMIKNSSDRIRMPQLQELELLTINIEAHPYTPSCKTPIEFRKFLFNYIS